MVDITVLGVRFRIIRDRGTLSGSIAKVLVGRGKWIGAGYKGGATLFFARGCSNPQRNMYVPVPFQFGITCNANAVPWTRN